MPRAKKQHLKQRADGRYCCKYHGIQFMGATEDEALALRDEYKRMEAQGMRRSPTVGQYAVRWLPIAKPNVAVNTYNSAAIMLDKLTAALGNDDIATVTPSQIKKLFSEAYKEKSDSYIKHAKHLYAALFDAAVEDGYCRTNPVRSRTAAPHKGTYTGHRALTPQERQWVETLCTDHRAYPAVMAMLYAGLRPQEAKALNIDKSVDFDSNTISVQDFVHIGKINQYVVTSTGKTEKATRTVPLFSPLRSVLQDKHGALAPSASGEPLTVTAWKRLWESYVSKMEEAINGGRKRWHDGPWITFTIKPYDLRHTFITWCRDNGVELHTVIEWAGHADSTMILKVYDEVSENRSQKEAERLEKIIQSMQNGMQTDPKQTAKP